MLMMYAKISKCDNISSAIGWKIEVGKTQCLIETGDIVERVCNTEKESVAYRSSIVLVAPICHFQEQWELREKVWVIRKKQSQCQAKASVQILKNNRLEQIQPGDLLLNTMMSIS